MMNRPAVCSLVVLGLCVLNANAFAADAWKPANGPLMTRWAKDVDPESALAEYPRPQMARTEWQSLNGLWDVAIVPRDAAVAPEDLQRPDSGAISDGVGTFGNDAPRRAGQTALVSSIVHLCPPTGMASGSC